MYSLLLVDDEILELETLRDYIDWKKMGFDRIYTAHSGREAYDKVQMLKPDVMIADIHMPGVSGIDLARQMYTDGCKTRIVFLTGYDEFEFAQAALQVSAVDYILKPFNSDKIQAAMNRVREQLEKEALLCLSEKVLKNHLIHKILVGDAQSAREACGQFSEICGEDRSRFGVVYACGQMAEKAVEELPDQLPEVAFSIPGGG